MPPSARHGGERHAAAPEPDDAAAAEEVALRILAAASQSAAALQRKLLQRGFNDATAATVTAAMGHRGYVDDDAFATAIASRRRRTGHGRIAIIAELRAKGIESEVVDAFAFAAAGDADDERGTALSLARHLARGSRDPATAAGRQRLGAALQRRGFDSETVHWALRALHGDPPR